MEKTYQPSAIESKWYNFWESKGIFKPSGDTTKSPYCIVIPPPNVTGTLHMGHAFQDTIMDFLIRYHRMKGDNTLWQPGTDHAGIATQMVVERQLNQQGLTRHDLGRNKFVERIWEWKEQSGGAITQQLRRMGASADWSRERFTMDAGLSEAVKKTFVDLYDQGLIYRGKRLVNWDPILKTAISDLEVLNEEENGFMYHVRYPFVHGQGLDGQFMEIATTRPETILADGALAVAPNDERYQKFVGKFVHVPMTERTIPIIEDEYVDPEFGTGCVKITPAHDFNDYQVGQRHEMEVINLMNLDVTLNENAPPNYQGLSREAARDKIVDDLKEAGLLIKVEPHKMMRPRGDRSGVVIEPLLTDQWYVDAKTMAGPAIEAVKSGKIKFVPANWEKTYFEWMNNIQDWCISRQLWWGHQIPAWYDEEGNIYVAHDEKEARVKYQLDDRPLTQDEDVLDTWFSSALWPYSTLGWPENTKELESFYPTSVLVTGFDIIFFWVARMIMMGTHFMKDIPFKEVYIHGLVRDQDGQKMSKSKGNVLDPIDLIDGIDLESLVAKRTTGLMQPQMAAGIEKSTRKNFPDGIKAYGTDALRFTFTALATNGRDVIFDVGRVEGYSNFCNKIWNAARFVFMNTEEKNIEDNAAARSHIDHWILSRLTHVNREVERHITQYRFDLATQTLYDFIWNEFCDWYLELTKPILNGDFSESEKSATRYTLIFVLDAILKMLHPFMPYITEEIWQKLVEMVPQFKSAVSISVASYPALDLRNEGLEKDIEWLQSVLLEVRRIRAEMNIAPGKPLPVLYENASDEDLRRIQHNELFALKMGRLESLSACEGNAPESAVAVVGKMRLLIPLAGLIDKDQELARLNREIAKLESSVTQLSGKLANESFIAKAPETVVVKEREKLADMENTLTELNQQLVKIKAL